MFSILSRPSVLKPHRYSVAHEGDLVALTIGNTTIKMRYEDAITLSQHLRVHGKAAKRAAGDQSRHWSAVAIMGGAPEK